MALDSCSAGKQLCARLSAFVVMIVVTIVSANAFAADVQPLEIEKYTKIVKVNNLAFPVVDYGKGPVVLMLHGFPDSRYVWRYQIKAVGDAGFRVLAPDLRGMGDAPRPTDPKDYGVITVIDDVL